MKYRESNLDKKLRKWFCKDNTKALLRSIQISTGGIRGLTSFKVNLDYPITAFAGVNGSGKSTMLALITISRKDSNFRNAPEVITRSPIFSCSIQKRLLLLE